MNTYFISVIYISPYICICTNIFKMTYKSISDPLKPFLFFNRVLVIVSLVTLGGSESPADVEVIKIGICML